MPSVLVETGFLTNKEEGKYLNSKKGQAEMALTIANAIIDYKNKVTNSFTELSTDFKIDENPMNVYLKVQIASGTKFLDLKPYNFKGLNQLTYSKLGKNYKYFFENTKSLKKANEFLEKAKKAGFKDALLVAFKNGKQISMNEFFLSNRN